MADDGDEEFSSADENDFTGGRQPGGNRPDDDFDNDFDDSAYSPQGGGPMDTMKSATVTNQPYDEAVELSDDEGEQPSPAPGGRADAADSNAPVANQPFDEAVELSSEDSVDDNGEQEPPIARPAPERSEMAGAPSDGRRPQGGPQPTLSPMEDREEERWAPRTEPNLCRGPIF